MSNQQWRWPIGIVLLLSMVAHKVLIEAAPGRAESASTSEKITPIPPEVDPPPAITFAAYGDMPYQVKVRDDLAGRTDDQVLIQDIAPKIRQRDDIPFVIHFGDLGRPDDACSDDWLRKSQAFWQTELIKPVFYTPGDNDWTDCDRQSLKTPQKETERLQAIRSILFSSPKTVSPEWQLQEIQKILANPTMTLQPIARLQAIRRILSITPQTFAREWRYETQSSLPENAIWWRNGVLFVTQHIVSTDNGRTEILLDDPAQAIKLVDERDAQNQIWLKRAFELAKSNKTLAVVVTGQLDPFGPAIAQETTLSRCLTNPAYQGFCSQLQTLAASSNKPVLFLHGDTNAYCLDQPFDQAKNIWRLNAPGDYQYIDAAVISVFPTNVRRPFQATGLLSGKPAPEVCNYKF